MLGHATAVMVPALAGAHRDGPAVRRPARVSWGMRGPLMAAIRADYLGSASFGTITGASSMIVMFGMIPGPLVAGLLADRVVPPGFTLLAALAAAGSVAFVRARRNGGVRAANGHISDVDLLVVHCYFRRAENEDRRI